MATGQYILIRYLVLYTTLGTGEYDSCIVVSQKLGSILGRGNKSKFLVANADGGRPALVCSDW